MDTLTDALRLACDDSLVVAGILGYNKFQTFLVTINTVNGVRTRTNYRLLLGDSLNFPRLPFAGAQTADGYLNPQVVQVSEKQVWLSNNQLTDKDFALGPLAYPYSYDGVTGGTPLANFDPPVVAINNTAIYLWLLDPEGITTPATGLYLKKLYHLDDNQYTYTIFWRNTGAVIGP